MDLRPETLAVGAAPTPRLPADALARAPAVEPPARAILDPLAIRRDRPHPADRRCGALCTPWCAAGW